jgi:hypothetical protein
MVDNLLYSFWEARASYLPCTRFLLERQPHRFRNFVVDVGLNFFGTPLYKETLKFTKSMLHFLRRFGLRT